MFRSCLLRLLAPTLLCTCCVLNETPKGQIWSKQNTGADLQWLKTCKTNVLQGLVWKPMPFQQFRHVATMFDTRNSSNPETSLVTMHPLIMSPLNLRSRPSLRSFDIFECASPSSWHHEFMARPAPPQKLACHAALNWAVKWRSKCDGTSPFE